MASSRGPSVVLGLSVLVTGLPCLGACERSGPGASSSGASTASGSSQSASASARGVAAALPAASASPSPLLPSARPSATASAGEAPLDLSRLPSLVDESGAPLPQTEDRPSATSPAFVERTRLLWRAIVAGDPSVAAPAFFPVIAYEQVKDIERPAKDHEARLMKAFARDIRAYHRKLGPDAPAAKLVGVIVDEARVKWMDRGKEGNKVGYFRVTRSKLRYVDAGGEERDLELTSLISWRGEWFVVHLHGFK